MTKIKKINLGGKVYDISTPNEEKMQSDITILQTDNGTLKSDVSSLKSSKVTMESDINTLKTNKIAKSEIGKANGVASLGGDGKIPAIQLPSYVDDVLEVATKQDLPKTGEAGKIYMVIDEGKIYRWTGSTYAPISDTITIGETSSTAFAGNRGVALENNLEELSKKVTLYHSSLSASVSPEMFHHSAASTKVIIKGTVFGTSSASMAIRKNGQQIHSVLNGTSITFEDTIKATTTYEVAAIIEGTEITKSVTATMVEPIFIGVGNTYNEIMGKPETKVSPRRTVTGDYPLTTKEGDKVYMCIPSTMSLSEAYIGKLNMPYQLETTPIEGYNIYSSVSTFKAQSFTLTLIP